MEEPAPKKRKGGQRQRIARAQEEELFVTGDSSLFLFLMDMFAWGQFSPQQVQHIAQLACRDIAKVQPNGSKFNDLETLASLGASGVYPNKIHGELMAKYGQLSKLSPPFKADLPFKEPLGTKPQAFLLPHAMFADMYHNYPEHWRQHVLPSATELGKFWAAVESHPQMISHPVKDRTGFQQLCVPIGLHGDGVPMTGKGKGWCKTMTLFSWTSLTATGNTKDIQFWIWGVFDKLCAQGVCDGTLHQFFKILSWSFFLLPMAGHMA
jgi:hypothetical protein